MFLYLVGRPQWSFRAAARIPWAPRAEAGPESSAVRRSSCVAEGVFYSTRTPAWWWRLDPGRRRWRTDQTAAGLQVKYNSISCSSWRLWACDDFTLSEWRQLCIWFIHCVFKTKIHKKKHQYKVKVKVEAIFLSVNVQISQWAQYLLQWNKSLCCTVYLHFKRVMKHKTASGKTINLHSYNLQQTLRDVSGKQTQKCIINLECEHEHHWKETDCTYNHWHRMFLAGRHSNMNPEEKREHT